MKGLSGLSPAALTAIARGDLKNAIVASTPGGIEDQEAEGQRQLCTAVWLPLRYGASEHPTGIGKAVLMEAGVVFGKPVDDIFQEVTLPEGWRLVPTDHTYWSELLDKEGRVRAKIFYKAAFYDRRADTHVATRYALHVEGQGPYEGIVTDGGKRLWSTGPQRDSAEYTRLLTDHNWARSLPLKERDAIREKGSGNDKAYDRALAYLNKHSPDWRQVQAYW